MNAIKHAVEQPFITATGIAALVHSTWALGTIFSGEQPAVEDIGSLIELVHFVGWIVPALLIAFALDVGQISTSNKIRAEGMTWGRGITFVVFSVATFFLQWFYMMHHIPLVNIGAGVSEAYLPIVTSMRDMGLFVVPALLPIATLLYTFSSDRPAKALVNESHSHDIQPTYNVETPIVFDDAMTPIEAFELDKPDKAELTYTRLFEANGWLFEMFYDRHTKQGYFTAQHGSDEPFYLAFERASTVIGKSDTFFYDSCLGFCWYWETQTQVDMQETLLAIVHHMKNGNQRMIDAFYRALMAQRRPVSGLFIYLAQQIENPS